ncbi:hypothetical protein HK102_006488 [Quaeritorhiza haematococci]|nr:hypothetical protein HK102_006488 [Quaeritorhiza haematococci]
MLPTETWSDIGAWLPDYQDFGNLAVALGVKWNRATQTQRMIRKYGSNQYISHIRVGDEGYDHDGNYAISETSRGFVRLSNAQTRYYKFLIKRRPHDVTRAVASLVVEICKNPENCVKWYKLQPFLSLGIKVDLPLQPDWLWHTYEWEPAFLELLLETGQLDSDSPALGPGGVPAVLNVAPVTKIECRMLSRLLRWRVPMDLDQILEDTIRDSNRQMELRFPRLQVITELLRHGADPDSIAVTPEDPNVIGILMLHGADPNCWAGDWYTTGDKVKIATCVDYGWLPPVEYVQSYFWPLLKWGCWDAADIFLCHYKRDLIHTVENGGLLLAIEGRQLDLTKCMVSLFPEILRQDHKIFASIVEWYAERDWKMDFGLIDLVLSIGCDVFEDTIMLCIEGIQREITRKVLFQPRVCTVHWGPKSLKDAPSWAPKLVRDVMYLRRREEKQRSMLFDLFDQDCSKFEFLIVIQNNCDSN